MSTFFTSLHCIHLYFIICYWRNSCVCWRSNSPPALAFSQTAIPSNSSSALPFPLAMDVLIFTIQEKPSQSHIPLQIFSFFYSTLQNTFSKIVYTCCLYYLTSFLLFISLQFGLNLPSHTLLKLFNPRLPMMSIHIIKKKASFLF